MTFQAFLPRDLPEEIKPLTELALDLRWTWSHATDDIWRGLDPIIWDATQNPWIILQSVSRERLATLAGDASFRQRLAVILAERNRYAAGAPSRTEPAPQRTAYFSMEFGLGEALPLYAGGLGVLAGDLLKSASDLGVPMVGVGLLYQEGYFRQTVDAQGRQQELYPYNDPTVLPIQPALAPEGGWLMISVALPGRTLWLRVWRANIGSVPLYLLDSNAPLNDAADRGITCKLYADGPETRLCQEIVLGIGGWRLLDALGISIGACHLNEGHAAFVVLERARSAMRAQGLSFRAALWATRAATLFTTHTPVAAGFDAFSPALLAKYFPEGRGYLADLGIGFDELLALGRDGPHDPSEPFRPAHLAFHGAARVNAVSRLHAETSRRMFRPFFPRWPEEEVPIGHVTNGIHVPSWDSRWADELWTTSCGRERWRGPVEELERASRRIDDHTLWTVRGRARGELVGRARARLQRQLARRGATGAAVAEVAQILDPDVLTLGFARRFAEYKRPNLLLRDPARLGRLLNDTRRPAQILIAGKAHPADREGKALVESWVHFAQQPAVRARCVFLEDYDFTLAQEMVQGVDVWMNTPRRPWEACGTSGMKVLVNGGLNLSVLDGWWAEAYAPELGWAIAGGAPGGGEDPDAPDAEALFRILESEVVPLFYDRDAEGLPRAWLQRVRSSLSRLTPSFSANRMVREYAEDYYQPASQQMALRLADGAALAKALEAWADRVTRHWTALRFGRLQTVACEAGWEISVEAYLDDLEPGDVTVELYASPPSPGAAPARVPMRAVGQLPGTSHGQLFSAIAPGNRAASDYTPRIVPASPSAAIPLELPLIAWHH